MTKGVGSREQGVGTTVVIQSHRDLAVWKKSLTLAIKVYRATTHFPASELYGLTSQIRRAGYSIPANIAEGYRRTHLEYVRFLRIAFGSASELETLLLMTKELELGKSEEIVECLHLTDEVLRMLNGMISRLS